MKPITALVAGETSGKIRQALINNFIIAYSCDLLPADDDDPMHIISDIRKLIRKRGKWDLIIFHPTCTKVCVSGNSTYAKGKAKHHERIAAAAEIEELWDKCVDVCDHVCFENPQGVLNSLTHLPQAQYLQPYEFGEDASKKTGLFLHGLPMLKPTKRVAGRWVTWEGKRVERWSNQTDSGQNGLGPSEDRWKLRAETYDGIADAVGSQWSEYLVQQRARGI